MIKFAKDTLFGAIRNYLTIYLPKQRRLSQHTIRSYKDALELLVDFIKDDRGIPLADVTFEMLTSDTIGAYLDYLEHDRGCSINTRNNRYASIRAFLKYAAAMDVTAAVFLDELKKVPAKKHNELEVVKYMTIPAVVAIAQQPDANTPKGLRDRFFMILMYDLAARLQEMVDIKLGDLHFGKRPTVTLHGKGGKIRTVPIMDKTSAYLRQYLNVFHPDMRTNESLLFYTVSHGKQNPISASCVRLFLTQYGSSARLECAEVPEKIHAHLWRHSRAMHLYQQGMDLTLLAQWLGHAQLESTRIYAYAETEQKQKAIAAATPPNSLLGARLSPERFTISDDETLKRLMGLY
jgi:site-specific recombinase XerD